MSVVAVVHLIHQLAQLKREVGSKNCLIDADNFCTIFSAEFVQYSAKELLILIS